MGAVSIAVAAKGIVAQSPRPYWQVALFIVYTVATLALLCCVCIPVARDKKHIAICALCAALPFVLGAVTVGVFWVKVFEKHTAVYSDTRDAFARTFQTITVSPEYAATLGIAAGNIFCDVTAAREQQDATALTTTDYFVLGNGLYGKIDGNTCTVAVQSDDRYVRIASGNAIAGSYGATVYNLSQAYPTALQSTVAGNRLYRNY